MSQPINMDAPQGASLLSTTFNTCQHCGAYIDLPIAGGGSICDGTSPTHWQSANRSDR